MQTITFEIRVSWDTANAKEAEAAMIEHARAKAQELLAIANLMSPRRPPQVLLQAGDFVATEKEIDVYAGIST